MRRSLTLVLTASAVFALWGWISPQAPEETAAAGPPPPYQVGDRLASTGTSGEAQTLELGWADLIPADWLAEEWLESLNLEELEDGDPRTDAVLEKILAEWEKAPVVESLHERRIRIPGFVVPLEGDGGTIGEFLLVPYFGACVHVPPPPANQLIHVLPEKRIPGDWNMMPVWVVGVLSVTRVDSELGSAGYQVRAAQVEKYEEEEMTAEPLPH